MLHNITGGTLAAVVLGSLLHNIMDGILAVLITAGSLAPGGSNLISNPPQTDYNNGRTTAPVVSAQTQRGINPVQHSE